MQKHFLLPLQSLVFLSFLLMAGCSSDASDDTSVTRDSHSEGDESFSPDGLDTSEDSEMPEHDVIVDGAEQTSPYGQEQWDLYKDGDFTREDYEQAFLNFVACVEDNDGWIHHSSLDDEHINYVTQDSSDPDDHCYFTHFGLLDMEWQIANPEDKSDAIQGYIDCLKDHDIDPAHETPTSELGNPQEIQLADLSSQVFENDIECSDTSEETDPFFDDIPYPE